EVAVYSSALTPQDITSHYQAAEFGPAPAPTAQPSLSVTQPTNATTYGAFWTGSVDGTALSRSGFPLAAVTVALRDTTTGQWWGGAGFNQASQTFVPVTSGTSTWSLSFPATNLTSGHSYMVTAQSTDTLGNTGASPSVGFSYNTNPPSTSIACNGALCSSGWYHAPVTVTLSATDPGGPGVSATYYTTDGSTPTASSTLYTGAFTVSTTSTVQFFSVDNAGNAESIKSQQVQISVLLSIAVTPANPSIPKGTTQQFTATGSYSDGSIQDLTGSATWVSSNPAVATITAGGLAGGAAQGTSQVSATSGGVTGSTSLTVGPATLV